jgi:hypothetical protein
MFSPFGLLPLGARRFAVLPLPDRPTAGTAARVLEPLTDAALEKEKEKVKEKEREKKRRARERQMEQEKIRTVSQLAGDLTCVLQPFTLSPPSLHGTNARSILSPSPKLCLHCMAPMLEQTYALHIINTFISWHQNNSNT